MKDDTQLVERRPTVAEYQMLRAAVAWPEVDERQVERGLSGDLYAVCAERNGDTIGCARLVGDGGIYIYIQDVIVLPDYQGLGVGRRLMDRIMGQIDRLAGRNTFVALMAAEGVVPFYQRYGFAARSADRPGMFRLWPG